LHEDGDSALAEDLLKAMHRNQTDFTLTFRGLCDAAESEAGDLEVRALFGNARDYDEWARRWRVRLARENTSPDARAAAMRQVNPRYIPRNHQIERIINAAVERADFAPFEELSKVLSKPYLSQAADSYANAPLPGERVLQTFCGT
jgi:uncharacterized protein YdiU (UPF0061 family)